MSEIDLNLENYDLDDILKLFRLDYDFGDIELRRVYKIVLQTHPDKSGLDKEIFLFYTSAFKKLKSIYKFKSRYEKMSKEGENCVRHGVYNTSNLDETNDLTKEEIERF